jgi:hypothetical protein
MPILLGTRPLSNTPTYYAIWNFIAKIWPEVTNYIEYGHFRYYTPTSFYAIITNDPDVLAYEPNIEKATEALISKLRSYGNQEVITHQPSDISAFVIAFDADMNYANALLSKMNGKEPIMYAKPLPVEAVVSTNSTDDLEIE